MDVTGSQMDDDRSDLRCPTCGIGVVVDLTHDDAPDGEAAQRPESRQTVTYSCGHVIVGASLASADPDALDVERRQSEETVDPSPAEPGTEPS
jgi:hypothetical protein